MGLPTSAVQMVRDLIFGFDSSHTRTGRRRQGDSDLLSYLIGGVVPLSSKGLIEVP